MIFTAHQPNFLPYPGFWLKMDNADCFGVMPKAQFSKGGHINRVQIGYDETKNWVTVPVVQKLGQRIDEVLIADNAKLDKLWRSIEQTYSKKKYWSAYGHRLYSALSTPANTLSDLNLELLGVLKQCLDVSTVVLTMPENSGNPSKDLLYWAIEQGCDTYVSGSAGRGYLDTQLFRDAKVGVYYQQCEIVENYRTVSILSVLMDFGPDWRSYCKQNLLVE